MLRGIQGLLRHLILWRRRHRLSSSALSLSSHFVFQTVSQKWLVRFNSDLACGCNWSPGCVVLLGDLKLPVVR